MRRPPKNRCKSYYEEETVFLREVSNFLAHAWSEFVDDDDELDTTEVSIGRPCLLIMGRTEGVVCYENEEDAGEYPALASTKFRTECMKIWLNHGPADDMPVGFVAVDWPYVVVRSIYGGAADGWWKCEFEDTIDGS